MKRRQGVVYALSGTRASRAFLTNRSAPWNLLPLGVVAVALGPYAAIRTTATIPRRTEAAGVTVYGVAGRTAPEGG